MVAAGYYLLAPLTSHGAAPQTRAPQLRHPQKERLDRLTSRELDVFRLVSHGWSNAEISRAFHSAKSTVNSHIRFAAAHPAAAAGGARGPAR
jgi:DNA-binding NarL/FixJ family response regulator